MSNKSLIKNVKIFGERNSGTNFLTDLITKNIKDINIYSPYYNGGTGWKHGFPRIESFKELDSTLFIFIIRDLNSWIKSMYFNPYSYKKPNDINDFLTLKLDINDDRKDHDVHIYKCEQQDVINLRIAKIKSYLNYYENVNNAVFINLEDLQNDNKKFLVFLKTIYNLNTTEYVPIKNHTKNSKLQKPNRNYDLIVPKIINKDSETEKFVESLKISYYYKSGVYQLEDLKPNISLTSMTG